MVDISPQNEAIKNRHFGNDKQQVIALSKQFIATNQRQGIIGTVKHFPGHGLVLGNTRKKSVYIDGPLQALDVHTAPFRSWCISIMMAQFTINNNSKYNTNVVPASSSRNIVTGLLKNELGFKDLVIKDALNITRHYHH